MGMLPNSIPPVTQAQVLTSIREIIFDRFVSPTFFIEKPGYSVSVGPVGVYIYDETPALVSTYLFANYPTLQSLTAAINSDTQAYNFSFAASYVETEPSNTLQPVVTKPIDYNTPFYRSCFFSDEAIENVMFDYFEQVMGVKPTKASADLPTASHNFTDKTFTLAALNTCEFHTETPTNIAVGDTFSLTMGNTAATFISATNNSAGVCAGLLQAILALQVWDKTTNIVSVATDTSGVITYSGALPASFVVGADIYLQLPSYLANVAGVDGTLEHYKILAVTGNTITVTSDGITPVQFSFLAGNSGFTPALYCNVQNPDWLFITPVNGINYVGLTYNLPNITFEPIPLAISAMDTVIRGWDNVRPPHMALWCAYQLVDKRRIYELASELLGQSAFSQSGEFGGSGLSSKQNVRVSIGEVFSLEDASDQFEKDPTQIGSENVLGDGATFWFKLSLWIRDQFERLFGDFRLRSDTVITSFPTLKKEYNFYAYFDSFPYTLSPLSRAIIRGTF